MFYTLQVFRALAALLVVVFHAGEILAKEKYFGSAANGIDELFWFGGQAGVAFFFVLSGFIISHVHWNDLNQPDKLIGYMKKRVVRIYPTYVAIFFAVYLAGLMVPSISETLPRDASVLIKSVLLVPQDKNIVGGMGAPVLIVAWSLQYEMMFYLVFAAGLVHARLMTCVLVGYGAIFMLRAFGARYGFPFDFLSSHLVLLFVMGVVTARLTNYFPRVNHAKFYLGVLGVLFAIVAVAASLNKSEKLKPVFDVLYGLVSAGLIYMLTRYEIGLPSIKKNKISMLLGDSSYALYLIHFPLMSVLCKLSVHVFPVNEEGAVESFLFIVSFSVLAGLLVHLYFERPAIKFLMGLHPTHGVR